jgi:hypothetical protein
MVNSSYFRVNVFQDLTCQFVTRRIMFKVLIFVIWVGDEQVRVGGGRMGLKMNGYSPC